MKKKLIALVAVASFLAAGSCITFKIDPLSPPEEVVAEIHICKKIDDSGELLKPVEITSEFIQDEGSIYCFISLKEISREIRMKWKWYSPDQKLYRESEEVSVNTEGVYLEEITAYDKITPGDAKEWQGRWQVVVLINDQLKAGKSFLLKSTIN